jgi:hypothetical protein
MVRSQRTPNNMEEETKPELTEEQVKILETKAKIDELLKENGLVLMVDHTIRIAPIPQ